MEIDVIGQGIVCLYEEYSSVIGHHVRVGVAQHIDLPCTRMIACLLCMSRVSMDVLCFWQAMHANRHILQMLARVFREVNAWQQ